jgi:hypothetical protein
VQDLLQGIRHDHLDGVALQVVVQLPGGDEEREEELLLHGVALARIPQHRADEVHRMLDEARSCGGSLLSGGPERLMRLGRQGRWLTRQLVRGLLRRALGR